MNASAIKKILSSKKIQKLRFGVLGALMGVTALMPTTALGWNYSDVPLFWVPGIKPNVVLMIDNSGSMQAITTNEAYQRALVSNSLSGTDNWYWCDGYDNSTKTCTSTNGKVVDGFSVYVWNPPTVNTATNTVNNSITVSRNLYNNATSPTDCSSSSSGFFWNGNVASPVSTTTYTPILGICSAGNAIPNGATIKLSVNAYKGSFTVDQTYYVVNSSPNGFQLSLTSGGAPVTVSVKLGSGSSWGSPATFGFNYSYNYNTYGVTWPGYINQSGVSLCNVTKSPGDVGFYLGESGQSVTVTNAADLIVPAANEVGVIVRNSNDTSRDSCVRWKMATTGNNKNTSTPAGFDYVRYTTGTLYDMDSQTPYGNFLLNSLVNGKGSYNFDNNSVYPDSDTSNRDWDASKDITIKNGGALTDNKYLILPNVTRMEAAREAAQKMVLDFYNKMNIGLFTLNLNTSTLTSRNVTPVADGTDPTAMKQGLIGTTEGMTPADLPASAVDGSIGKLIPGSGTPLAITENEINSYFLGSTSPVKYRCQKNYAVVITDGDPSSDSGTLDGRTQEGYDNDLRTATDGNDADGVSWDDPTDSDKWKTQNIVEYSIGVGLENNLLKRAPLVNQVDVDKSGIVGNVIELKEHGLSTGNYVQVVSGAASGLTNGNYYYAVVIDADHFKLAGAGTISTITSTVDSYTATTTYTRTCKTHYSNGNCKTWNNPTNTASNGPTSTSTSTNTTGGITGDGGNSTTNTRSSVDACIAGTSTVVPAGSPSYNSAPVSDTGWTPANSTTTQTRVVVTNETKSTPVSGTQINGGCAVIAGGSGTMVLSTGPGKAFFAFTPDQLALSMKKVFDNIQNINSSASSVSTNTKQFSGGETALVYQAKFNTEDWSGEVAAYPITVDGTGKATVDTTKDPIAPGWTTKETLQSTSQKTPNIFTWNRSAGTAGAGVDFAWTNLDAGEKAALGGAVSGAKIISWIQGNNVGGLRSHSSKGLMGDVLNSDPVYLSYLSMGYQTLPASNTSTCTIAADYSSESGSSCTGAEIYTNYVTASKMRPPMIFVGANDGQMHAFNAEDGTETMAYLPAAIYRDWNDLNNNGVDDDGTASVTNKLQDLTSPSYSHEYFVDGSLSAGDAFLGSKWGTYLIGALGRGGRSIFAMDITDTTYTANDIKWEFTNPDMGYTYGKPIIARLANNKWYAVVPNGLDSNGDQASVFLINLNDATDYVELKTGSGSAATPNGMMAVQVKVDSSRTVTDIYAGDMLGNIWKFDVYDEGTASVDLSPSAQKLFTAGDGTTGTPQAITGGIRIGKHPDGLGSLIYFGTGKYFEVQDNIFSGSSVPQIDSFYSVLDDGSTTGITRSDLASQSFIMSADNMTRTATVNTVTYTGAGKKMGWYIDLLDGTAKKGERMVSTPVLYGGRVIFVTIKPLTGGTCGGEGSSWLNELNALDGSMLPDKVLDTNNDGKIDNADVQVSSAQLDGLASDPSIIEGQDRDYKVIGSTSTTKSVQIVSETPPSGGGGLAGGKGRMSWRQLQ